MKETFPWHMKAAVRLNVIMQNSLQSSSHAGIVSLKLLCVKLETSLLFQRMLFSEKAGNGKEMLIWIPSSRDT